MPETPNVVDLFLAGARTVRDAISEPAVEECWDQPSVLEEQDVSGLAGHLARGGVSVVLEYLQGGTPAGPVDHASAGAYFAAFADAAGPELHQAIRDRGAAAAAVGYSQLLGGLEDYMVTLEKELSALPGDRLVAVFGGRVMRLEDYLATRIVEQAVHLDDLARSVGRDTGWPLPDEHRSLAIAVGVEIARRRSGPEALIRGLYRQGFAAESFPVL